MKSFISFILVFSLIFQNVAFAENDQEPIDPSDVAKLTHLFLKAKVGLTLKSSLILGLHEAMASSAAGMTQIQAVSSEIENEIPDGNQNQFRSTIGFPIQNNRNRGFAKKHVKRLYRGVSDALNTIRKDRAKFQRRLLNISQLESNQYQIARDFVSNIDSLCTAGVGFDPLSPELPKMKSLMRLAPAFHIQIPLNATGQLENNFQAPPISLPNAGQYGGAAEMLLFIGSLQWSAKAWIFSSTPSWTIFANEFTASQYGAAFGMTLGITLAIAAAILVTEYYLQQKESVRGVKRNVSAFLNMATGEDGIRYFKDECRIVNDHLSKLMPRLTALKERNLDEIELLKKEMPTHVKRLEVIFNAIEGYVAKNLQLRSKYEKKDQKEADSAITWELNNSSEKRTLDKVIGDLSPLSLAQLIETEILNGYFSISVTVRDRISRLNSVRSKKEIDQMADTEMKLFDILRESNIRSESLNLNPSWQEELKSNKEINLLHEEFENIVLLKSEILVSEFFGENTEKANSQLEEKRGSWMRLWTDTSARFGESSFLKYLKECFLDLGEAL